MNDKLLKLPKPILIRPDIDHEIQLRMNSMENTWYVCWALKPTVDLGSNIVVRFCNDPILEDRPTRVINRLTFNSLEYNSK